MMTKPKVKYCIRGKGKKKEFKYPIKVAAPGSGKYLPCDVCGTLIYRRRRGQLEHYFCSRACWRKGASLTWSAKRRAQHVLNMQKGSSLQNLMQEKGNQQISGKPSNKIGLWIASHPEQFKEQRKQARSTLIKNYKGRPSKGFVKGRSGHVNTRFGKFRFDSDWERLILLALEKDKTVVAVSRDYPIPYLLDGEEHFFLVDFFVQTRKKGRYLIEAKCPYVLEISLRERKKIRAVRRYAVKQNFCFILVSSKKEAKDFHV